MSGSLVSIAISGKMKANPDWNLLATYKMAAPWNRRPCLAEHLEQA